MRTVRVSGTGQNCQRGSRVRLEYITDRPGWAHLADVAVGTGPEYEIVDVKPIRGRKPPAAEVTVRELHPD